MRRFSTMAAEKASPPMLLRNSVYTDVYGFDIRERLKQKVEAGSTPEFRFNVPGNYILPYEDDFFDLIISDQVMEHVCDQACAYREIYRILKPGGTSVHIIPAKYDPIEPHIKVPFGGLISSHWWFKIWAFLGIRNRHQKNLDHKTVARNNTYYCVAGLRYIGNSSYKVLWDELGYDWKFATLDYLHVAKSAKNQKIAKIAAAFPPLLWMFHLFHVRVVVLRKPLDSKD